ncbi:MAG TPA: SufS family cysteine desulfurase [Candidatus Bilamarchaeum sp.]|nr:SufS family cysteine desulfurase [Candidatus Bilamarchaeum sp.]
MLDVDAIRRDFPILDGKLIYLDSAATSQRPRQVIDAVSNFYKTFNANVYRGLYPIAEAATLEYEGVREKAAKFIRAEGANQVIFTKNTTEGSNVVMRGWGEKFLKKGGKVVATLSEHHSNFVPWQELARRKKCRFEVVGVDGEGRIDLADAEKKLKGAGLFAFSAASNVTGAIAETEKLCSLASDNGAISFVDGAQFVPSNPTDVRKFGCDFLAFSGHKMLAPFGSGVLYGREELLERMDPLLYGSEMIRSVSVEKTELSGLPNKFEAGTPAVDAIIGLGAAIDYLNRVGMEDIRAHEDLLVGHMLRRLQEIPGLDIIGPKTAKGRAALVAFALEGIHPHDVAAMLAEDNICVRSGHHCAMPIHEELGIAASTRASVYLYNRKDEIDALAESLKKAKKVFG